MEINQPTRCMSIIVDAAGRVEVLFSVWHPVTGARIKSGRMVYPSIDDARPYLTEVLAQTVPDAA